jgi:hypothetical protein
MNYKTHLPVLELLFDMFDIRKVVELGVGVHSTTFFKQRADTLIAVDSDYKWIDKVKEEKIGFSWHVGSLAEFDIPYDTDLVFIDGNPANARKNCVINAMAANIKLIVAHDTEPQSESLYGYRSINDPRYTRTDYDKVIPWTSVFSKELIV